MTNLWFYLNYGGLHTTYEDLAKLPVSEILKIKKLYEKQKEFEQQRIDSLRNLRA